MNEQTQSLTDIVTQDPKTWLYCLHCGLFFQAERLESCTTLEGREKCPFCPAEGLGIDIFQWRPFRSPAGWPQSKRSLSHGLPVP